jgi:glycosyltransferase involved in cell wall biosynthesis
MISFIIPAHNEELWVGRSISAIRAAMEMVGGRYEIIVVDDASADATARVAEEHGARVVRVAHRQIAATRNSGAREAQGALFFFVDADTLANPGAIQQGLRAMQAGAVGGGACSPSTAPYRSGLDCSIRSRWP